jgi:hypothetical protein
VEPLQLSHGTLRFRGMAETRLSTTDLFFNPIEHGCNQTIGIKKEPKNHTIEHENECDVAALYRRILFDTPFYCAFKIFL